MANNLFFTQTMNLVELVKPVKSGSVTAYLVKNVKTGSMTEVLPAFLTAVRPDKIAIHCNRDTRIKL